MGRGWGNEVVNPKIFDSMRPIKFVSRTEEFELIDTLGDELLEAGWNAFNSTIITVSTDYSAIVGQILRHHLSYDGEICDGFGIDVPYPDEEWDDKYIFEMRTAFQTHKHTFRYKTPILVEAGVIRGGNYTYVIDWMRRYLGYDQKIITLALFENLGSKFKSDFVGDYYDDTIQDLTFWWERDNNHWK
jgi:hypothetical protein